ncbi:multimerin-2a isoform X2 [Acanthopagrus latus]|uniref:multimerin-2a isoform X2 n=1 Tax=Acanthopagrus latus TaxID=8177 RepID=UPI00187CBD71|nr:multimerin-2a isoform X2 [Acanthopagrus latus]
MTAVGELVLVLGLLVSAHCEVRPRDPEVEEEEELGGRAGGGGGGAVFSPLLQVTHTALLEDRGSQPTRTGNWCALVQQRVVTMAETCGTEKYIIQAQSPCPSGKPDCQLVMYKTSMRPIYRQTQKVVTALLWRCCPGHGGHNCEDTGFQQRLQQQRADPDREQNDQEPNNTSAQEHHLPDTNATLPVHQMMTLIMSQLNPLLEGFNRSLEHLSRQVGDLARDVAHLKSSQLGAELQAGPPDGPDDEVEEERLDAKLEEVFRQVREVREQMESQRRDTEDRLHSQHAMLHYNLTNFKMDIDMKLKRHHKMLQVSLQAMNASLVELKLDQDQTAEVQVEEHLPPLHPLETSDTSALWEAVERLDNMVVNNTVKVGGLMEDVEVTSGSIQQLRRDLKQLDTRINQTARNSQIQFMETGLEVEAAKEVVLRRVEELAGNLSQHDMRLQEADSDVDYLYTVLYKHNSSADCDCKALKAAMTRLERGVANVTELANENRLALEETSEVGAGQWGGASNWEPAVQVLQHDLQQVKEALASEQTRIRTLDHSLTQLSSSVKMGLAEVSGLKESDRKLVANMQHLSGSFDSLLKDASRHSDVLEQLMGEEVMEFLEWPVQDQEAHSIPALKEQLGNVQEQLRRHNLSITSLLGNSPGGREEVPSADQPSSSDILHDDWLPGSMRSSSEVLARERQLLLHSAGRRPELGGDGSDLWNLEKTVEELELKVLRLEEKTSNTSTPSGVEAELLVEVMWLKRGLEEHLRVFKNVFSNADILAESDATLELDKLWQLVKNKEGKKEKKRGGGRGGNHRSRRETSGVVALPSSLSEASLLLVAGSPLSVSSGVIVFKAALSGSHSYSDSGSFMPPVNGVYLFVLTLDLRLGSAHVVLTRGSGGTPASLHQLEVAEEGPVTAVSLLPLSQGEEVRLELKGGAWVESEDNVFTIVLLHQTT